MKCLKLISSIFILCIASYSHAYVVNDVREFDAIYHGGELRLEYNLADYGFLAGRDTLVALPTLTLEVRDPDYRPDKDWSEQPFLMMVIDQARYFTRVGAEDWIERGFFNEEGIMPVAVLFDSIDVWLGDLTLNFEFTPGPTQVPEPAPFILLAAGLAAVGLGRYRHLFNRRV